MDKSYRLQGIEFEWDEGKYAVNLRKHGIRCEEAAEVFFDLLAVYDSHFVEHERRDTILGYSQTTKILLVVFVEREDRTRILSARRATPAENEEYAKKNFEREG